MKLKPCPFCGGEAKRTKFGRKVAYTEIVCSNCDATMRGSHFSAPVERWNTRTSGWIPVSERLPDTYETVLCFDAESNCGYNIGKYEVCNGAMINEKWMWFSQHIKPTHWMSLPTAPQPPED